MGRVSEVSNLDITDFTVEDDQTMAVLIRVQKNDKGASGSF
jgi:hypothetical protein